MRVAMEMQHRVGHDRTDRPMENTEKRVRRRWGAAPQFVENAEMELSTYSIMNSAFRVGRRYSGLRGIGQGSYGVVCSAWDANQEKKVAIKKIHPMARDVNGAKHVLREIRLMRYLGAHENIVRLEDLFVSEYHDEVYIVMELLDCDLHHVINKTNQPLGNAHHRCFMFQILRGVKFLHDNRIIHRDLKPKNVLVTKNCKVRIADFGMARLRPMGRGDNPDDEVKHPMTETAVTRWYRPPELMLCPDGLYGYTVDLWSIGCIFAELLGRRPFFPGETFKDQLALIFDVVGCPKPNEVAHIRNPEALRFLESMHSRVKVPYAYLFPSASEQAVDLLENFLVFHPPARLSVNEALDHPYFQPIAAAMDIAPDPVVAPGFEFDFESRPIFRAQLRSMILREVQCFRAEQLERDDRERYATFAAAVAALHPEPSSPDTTVNNATGNINSGSGNSKAGQWGNCNSEAVGCDKQDGEIPQEQTHRVQEGHQGRARDHKQRKLRFQAPDPSQTSPAFKMGARATKKTLPYTTSQNTMSRAHEMLDMAPCSTLAQMVPQATTVATVTKDLGSAVLDKEDPIRSLWQSPDMPPESQASGSRGVFAPARTVLL